MQLQESLEQFVLPSLEEEAEKDGLSQRMMPKQWLDEQYQNYFEGGDGIQRLDAPDAYNNCKPFLSCNYSRNAAFLCNDNVGLWINPFLSFTNRALAFDSLKESDL